MIRYKSETALPVLPSAKLGLFIVLILHGRSQFHLLSIHSQSRSPHSSQQELSRALARREPKRHSIHRRVTPLGGKLKPSLLFGHHAARPSPHQTRRVQNRVLVQIDRLARPRLEMHRQALHHEPEESDTADRLAARSERMRASVGVQHGPQSQAAQESRSTPGREAVRLRRLESRPDNLRERLQVEQTGPHHLQSYGRQRRQI